MKKSVISLVIAIMVFALISVYLNLTERKDIHYESLNLIPQTHKISLCDFPLNSQIRKEIELTNKTFWGFLKYRIVLNLFIDYMEDGMGGINISPKLWLNNDKSYKSLPFNIYIITERLMGYSKVIIHEENEVFLTTYYIQFRVLIESSVKSWSELIEVRINPYNSIKGKNFNNPLEKEPFYSLNQIEK